MLFWELWKKWDEEEGQICNSGASASSKETSKLWFIYDPILHSHRQNQHLSWEVSFYLKWPQMPFTGFGFALNVQYLQTSLGTICKL